MNKLKKVLAGLLAVSCILTTASCSMGSSISGDSDSSGNGGGNKNNNSASTADQVMDKAYQAIEMDTDVSFRYIDNFMALGDTGNILVSGYNDDKNVLYVTDSEFSSFSELPFELPEADNIETYYRSGVTPSGNIMILATITDYGDAERPDYDDPDFDYDNFDFEAMYAAAQTTQSIYLLDKDGNVFSQCDIEGLEKYSDEENGTGDNVYIQDFYPIGEDKALISISGMNGQTYLCVDVDGKLSEPLKLTDGNDTWFYPTGMDKNGNFVYMTYENSNRVINIFEGESMSVKSDPIKIEDSDMNYSSIMRGSGDYDMYLSSSNSLYGVKADGTVDEIINWIDSDITGDYVQGIVPLEDGDFIIFEQNWSNGSSNFYRLTKRDASELQNTKVINMVVQYNDSQLSEMVKEFNKTNSDYRIKMEDYSKYYDWDEESGESLNSPEKQLKQDIAAGKTFDIICMNGSSSLYTNLANKGALVDLYEYLGKDGTISKEELVAPILSAGEVNGKLVSLSPSFSIDVLAAKSKYCDKENWTVDDVIETYNSLPDGMKLQSDGNTKTNVLGLFIYGTTDLIDYANGTCDFDSDDFKKILEFCNQFDNEGEGDEINWETASNDEIDAYWNERETACLNDKALLDYIYFSDFREYARAKQATFNDDITLVGYPSSNGVGARVSANTACGIMANSEYKDVCWKFISEMFSEENQSSENLYNIPARMSAFEKRLDDAMGKPYYIDENGKKQEYDDTYYIGNEPITIDPITKEERDYLKDYVLNAKSSGFIYDEKIYEIINEEVESYFAGEKSADETAKIIQNRVSILVSEQY